MGFTYSMGFWDDPEHKEVDAEEEEDEEGEGGEYENK
jgi:hypothetical protein